MEDWNKLKNPKINRGPFDFKHFINNRAIKVMFVNFLCTRAICQNLFVYT